MISWLRGRVLRAASGAAVIDVGGVGYRVVASDATVSHLQSSSGEVELSVHTIMRADALVLYGFCSEAEREVFEVLLTIHSVGPALALAIIGELGADGVIAAASSEDAAAFEQVNGVGKKTAARLALELKGSTLSMSMPTGSGTTTSSAAGEVADALVGLGYSGDEVDRVLARLDEDLSTEAALRLALRELSRR